MSGWQVLFPWRRQVRPGSAGCPQPCAPSPSSLLPPPPPPPLFPAQGKQRAPGAPPAAPAATSQVAPLSCLNPGSPGGPGRPPQQRLLDCPGPEEEAVGGMEEREVGPTSMPGSNPDGKQRWHRTWALALAWLWLGWRRGLRSGAAPNSSPKGPGNSPESRERGEQARVWGGGAKRGRVGRGEGRDSWLASAPLSTRSAPVHPQRPSPRPLRAGGKDPVAAR